MKKTIAILTVLLLLLSGCKAGKEPSNAAPATPVEDAAAVDTGESKDSATESTDLEETSGQIRFWELVDEMTTEQAQEILSRKPESDRYSPLTPEERMALYQLFCEQINKEPGDTVLFDFWFCSTFQENPADYLLEENSWEKIGLDLDIQQNVNLHFFDYDYLSAIEEKNPEPYPVSCNISIYHISTERSTQALKSIYRHYLSLEEISYANGDMNIMTRETA